MMFLKNSVHDLQNLHRKSDTQKTAKFENVAYNLTHIHQLSLKNCTMIGLFCVTL